jgi:nucleotide-binding universal stress UspA family protein
MKILVGVDGSKHSIQALEESIKLVKKFTGSIVVITIYTLGNEEEADKIRQDIVKLQEEETVDHKFMGIVGSNPSRALIDLAMEEKCDLIAVGSRGLGSTATFFLGSVSKEVVAKSRCNVLVVKTKSVFN